MNLELQKSGQSFLLKNPTRLEQDDYDFRVDSPDGPAYLELVEFAPPSLMKSGGYSKIPNSSYSFGRGLDVWKLAARKGDKYPVKGWLNRYLLVYTTHYALNVDNIAIKCAQYFMRASLANFRAIFLFNPFSIEMGTSHWLYPVDPVILRGFSPWAHTDHHVIRLDPQKFFVVGKGKSSTLSADVVIDNNF